MCRVFSIALALFVFARQGLAQDAKPNTLTPKEIAAGWILVFDGETTFGWNVTGNLSIADGWLVIGGKEESSATLTTQFPWTCALWYEAYQTIDSSDERENPGVNLVEWKKNGARRESHTVLGKKPQLVTTGWDPQSDAVKSTVKLYAPAGSKLYVRSLRLSCALKMSWFFNSKDLSGWKIHPGKKSEFAVIDGAINIKNGPGDLQTEKKFGDFCLQLECISHGEHLNSGVFFRCRDGEYQNGYEAQIRNQFTAKPTQKYLLEEYDPMTHKLLGKKETLFTAVDFGTGAIYRRQPARKEVAKDKEWFTMTVVAHGNHFATWVNGIQVTDWYDNRPKSDNARTGCRLEAGHISLQGHDPTTNLSFKNIRIQEYPSAK